MSKQDLYDMLLSEYPDGNIHGLTKRPGLYALLKDFVYRHEMESIECLMQEMGFRYKTEATLENKRITVTAWLKSSGNQKQIKRADIPTDIYLNIIMLTKTDGLSISSFLQQYGYSYIIERNKSNYDYHSILRLSEEYDYTQAEILKLLNLSRNSRQTISNIVRSKTKNSGDSWLIKELNEFDEENIIHMVANGLYDYEVVGNKYCLRNNKNGKVFFCIDRELQYSFVFDEFVPDEIRKEIKNKHMDFLTPREFEFKIGQQVQHIIGKPCIVINGTNQKEFARLRSLRKNPEKEDYAILFGLTDFPQKVVKTDEEIYSFLKKHSDENYNVAVDTANIQSLRSYHQRVMATCPQFKNSKFSDFIDFFGFSWNVNKGHEGENTSYRESTDDLYKKILATEYAMFGTNIVSFKSTESIYARLYALAKRRNLSLDEYIAKLGFKRSVLEKSNPEDLLKQLDTEIAREMKQLTTQNLLPVRNHHLVSRLKTIYQCRCQLCNQERYFDIIFNEEKPEEKYVEVHHIVEISKVEDEEGTLDRLSNLIVVCPNHHKWLHYQKGGGFRLKKQGELLTLTNQKDSVVIETNYHLKGCP